MKRLALLALLGCARPPALPAVPSSFPSALGPVPVVWVDSLRGENGQLVMGAYSPPKRTIFISTLVVDRTAQIAVYYHEACHVILLDHGLHNLIAPPVVQTLCDVWAVRETQALMARRP